MVRKLDVILQQEKIITNDCFQKAKAAIAGAGETSVGYLIKNDCLSEDDLIDFLKKKI